jgi:hypothetical protein
MMSAYIANLLVLDRRNDVAAAETSPIDLSQMSLENGMSALGQKQTFVPQKVMSALPRKADITAFT